MTSTQNTSSETTDKEYPGYYYDGNTGKIVELEVADGRVDYILLDEDKPSHSFEEAEHFDPEEEELRRVPEYAINNPVRIAREVYNHGYSRTDSVLVDGMRFGIPSIEYADSVIEIVEA